MSAGESKFLLTVLKNCEYEKILWPAVAADWGMTTQNNAQNA